MSIASNQPNDRPEKALRLVKQGVSIRDIAARFGVGRTHVYWLLKKAHERREARPANS